MLRLEKFNFFPCYTNKLTLFSKEFERLSKAPSLHCTSHIELSSSAVFAAEKPKISTHTAMKRT